MLRRYIFVPSIALLCLFACKSSKPAQRAVQEVNEDEIVFQMGDVSIYAEETDEDYDYGYREYQVAPEVKGSATRIMDLIHTQAKVSFNWEKQWVMGTATLRLKPYNKPIDSFYIDAVGMEIHSVQLRVKLEQTPCAYLYDGSQLLIRLPRTFSSREELQLIIDYTAKPEELESEGGRAITDNKGLYFINPLGKEKGKARQIWTQGETQSTSAWLPTIDAPNEKMTHDLFILVNDSLQTISNGEFVSSSQESNGMRTDHWLMEKPHAPYLVALIVGQFYTEKAEWNDMPLTYYTDPKYSNSTKTIFKNTPEMIEFFSNKMGYPYPWPKYDQVVVDDFVSGAMENTTITVYGQMLQLSSRELLDRDYEDVIAHELFHHWFGDLVTCESWGQLPLNESFATYGEYLWREHKYGRDNADEHLSDMLQEYFSEAMGKQVKLIRNDYTHQDEMFDAHSYQKGGLILHMLRKYIGDDAFFAGLNLYLKKFQYGTAEIHNLRQCFEETSGEDLTWFFDQWFFKPGHPKLEVNHLYEEESDLYSVAVNQTQDMDEFGVYRLPIRVTLHFGDSSYSQVLDIRSSSETYYWNTPIKPDWVSFDEENQVLASVREIKTEEEWLAQLRYSKKYKDRENALLYLDEEGQNMELLYEACAIGLSDPYYAIRNQSMTLMRRLAPDRISSFATLIIDQAENHPKSATRAAAFALLTYNPVGDMEKTIEKGLNDSSFQVNAAALNLLFKTNKEMAVMQAEKWASSPEDGLKYSALGVLASSEKDHSALFIQAWNEEEGSKFYLVAMISQYLRNSDDPDVAIGLLNVINDFEPVNDDDYFPVLFIIQTNQQTEAKWLALKEEADLRVKSNPSPENLASQKKIQQVLDAILHIN